MRKCSAQDCGKPGTHTPVIEFRVHEGHQPADASMGLRLCRAHCDEFSLDDFFAEGGFEAMADAFHASGKARPIREKTTVRFDALD